MEWRDEEDPRDNVGKIVEVMGRKVERGARRDRAELVRIMRWNTSGRARGKEFSR